MLFLRFGCLAWGGPVAQIAMVRGECVDRRGWISPERFNRALAVYQALPGPEAHELCVYLGTVRRGRLGGLLAGLGFMLPGLGLMLALAWLYVRFGLSSPWAAAALAAMTPAVAALVVRATHRIAGHALHASPWLVAIAITAAGGELCGVSFPITLLAAGLAYALHARGDGGARLGPALVGLGYAGLAGWSAWHGGAGLASTPLTTSGAPASLGDLALAGLRAGLLTFGGAYTVIPFLREDAVVRGGWVSDAQFLDGIALGGVLPAPLIIFATFVGYLAGGLAGALAITATIFLPAFAFSLIGHGLMERLIDHRPTHALLDGVTAGVVGLIGVTAVRISLAALAPRPDAWAWALSAAIFAGGLVVLYRWTRRAAIPLVVLGAGALGLLRAALA